MQNILSIDTTSNPAKAFVVEVEGRNVRVLEQRNAAKGDVFSQNGVHKTQSQEAPPEQDGENNEESPDLLAKPSNRLGELLSSIQTPWTSAILIIPPDEHLSLNLESAFGDAKNIDKILDMEVQDLVPFDVSEFLLQAALPAVPLDNGKFDIHVNMIPKHHISNVLQACKDANFEPFILSTPSGILGAAYYLAPDYLDDNSAIIFVDNDTYHLAIAFDGMVLSDRILRKTDGLSDPATDLKLSIAAAERHYQKTIKTVYLIGKEGEAHKLQQILGRNVETLKIGELVDLGSNEENIASLGSVFAQDYQAPNILTNFRVREFSYSPQLKELFRRLKQLTPYFLLCILAFILCMTSVYVIRQQRINSLERAVNKQIKRVIPSFNSNVKDPTLQLQSQLKILDQQLQAIGSSHKFSPLDSLAEVSKGINATSGIDITLIEIKGGQIKLEGYAPSYQTIDRIKNELKRQKRICNRIKEETNAAGRNRYGFTFHITICE